MEEMMCATAISFPILCSPFVKTHSALSVGPNALFLCPCDVFGLAGPLLHSFPCFFFEVFFFLHVGVCPHIKDVAVLKERDIFFLSRASHHSSPIEGVCPGKALEEMCHLVFKRMAGLTQTQSDRNSSRHMQYDPKASCLTDSLQ